VYPGKLLNAPEGEHFEFKEAKTRFDFGEATKYCCALANCGGGKLVFGITDKRPKGTPLKELHQVLPSHSRSQIQVLLRELQNETYPSLRILMQLMILRLPNIMY